MVLIYTINCQKHLQLTSHGNNITNYVGINMNNMFTWMTLNFLLWF